MVASRKRMSQQHMDEVRRTDRESRFSQRRNLTQDQREENRRLQRQRTEYYNKNLHKDKNQIATMMQEILNGDIYIAPLHESNESIGEM